MDLDAMKIKFDRLEKAFAEHIKRVEPMLTDWEKHTVEQTQRDTELDRKWQNGPQDDPDWDKTTTEPDRAHTQTFEPENQEQKPDPML